MTTTHQAAKDNSRLRQEIIMRIKAGGVEVDGSIWLALVFMDKDALTKVARGLGLNA